jgi:hypothetical protein
MIFMIMLADNEASATADNRAYLATVLRTSAQIPLRGTSDTLETLTNVKFFTFGSTSHIFSCRS